MDRMNSRARWLPLARAECRTLLSSKPLWVFTCLLVVWMYRPNYIVWHSLSSDMVAGYVQYSASLVLPFAVILLCYHSIVGEDESGSIKFLLGMPISRKEIIVAKIAGRGAGISLAILIATGVVTVIGAIDHGIPSLSNLLAVLLVTILYAYVLVTISVAVSAFVRRSVTAAGILFVGFLVFDLFWQFIAAAIGSKIAGGSIVNRFFTEESVILFLERISPTGAYHVTTNWIIGAGNSAASHNAVLTELQPNHSTNILAVETSLEAGTHPLYLHESIAIAILLIWASALFSLSVTSVKNRDYT